MSKATKTTKENRNRERAIRRFALAGKMHRRAGYTDAEWIALHNDLYRLRAEYGNPGTGCSISLSPEYGDGSGPLMVELSFVMRLGFPDGDYRNEWAWLRVKATELGRKYGLRDAAKLITLSEVTISEQLGAYDLSFRFPARINYLAKARQRKRNGRRK
jgi:hypothetical protein